MEKQQWRATALAMATAVLLGVSASDASALALGRVTVQSALGEPLRADIEIPEINADEIASLRAAVASPDAFRAAGFDFNPSLSGLTITLQKRADGRHFLRLTSSRPINDPFIDLILEANWSSGRIVRDYTMLFDPPNLRQAPAPLAAQVPASPAARAPAEPTRSAAAPSPSVSTPPTRTAPQRAAATTAPQRAAATATPAGPQAGGGDRKQVTVQSGETAGKIAATHKPANVSLDQMLVALLRANPDAFVGGNVNRVRAGAVLEVPSAEDVGLVPSGEASQTIVAQSRDFNEFRRRLAEGLPTTRIGAADRQSSGRVQAQVDEKAPSATAPDKLTLSKGAVAGKANADQIARDRAAKDASTRVAELNKNISDLNKLTGPTGSASTAKTGIAVPLGTASGARPAAGPAAPVMAASAPKPVAAPMAAAPVAAPASAAKPASATAVTVAKAASAPVAAASPLAAAPAALTPASAPAAAMTPASAPAMPGDSTIASTASSGTAPASSAAPAAGSAPEPQAAGSAPAVAAAAAAAASRPKPAATPTPPAETSLVDDLLANPISPATVGGLLAFLLGFAFYRAQQRKKSTQVDSSFLESRLQPDSFFGASGGQRIDTNEGSATGSSMVYSPSQLDAAGDVDPVAEADVYLAYGRDLQAEEILKEAMRTTPNRVAVHSKLLEIYSKRRDTKAFELVATEAYALTRGEGPEWEHICELGQELDPSSSLYRPGGQPPGGAAAAAAAAAVSTGAFGATANTQPMHAASTPPVDLDLDLDFSLGDDEPTTSSAPTVKAFASHPTLPLTVPPASQPEPMPSLDMDFGSATVTLDPPAVSPKPVRLEAPDLTLSLPDVNSLNFTPEPPKATAAPAPAADAGMIEFDLGALSLDLDTPPSASAKPAIVEDPALSTTGAPISTGSYDGDVSGDPLATKLALAHEFNAIGDPDGARSLAQEVLAEASGDLKNKAQRFLAEIS